MKKILIVIGILLLSLSLKAQPPGQFSFVIVRDSICFSQGGGLDCLTFIMGDSTVSPEWVRDYVRDNTGVPDSVNIVYLTVSGSAFIDSLDLDYLSIGDSPGVDTLITLKDAVNAEQFDSIHVDTAHVDHDLFVRDTAIVELIETHGAGKPEGAFGDIQYNNSGVFDGAPLTTDGTDLEIESDVILRFGSYGEFLAYSGIDAFQLRNTTSADNIVLGTYVDGILIESPSQNVEIKPSGASYKFYPDSFYTAQKLTSKQFAGQLVVSTPLTLLLDVDDQFYTLTGLTSDIEENTTLTDSTITLGSESYGLYHFFVTLTVQHTKINAELTCTIFLNDVATNATETQTVDGSGEPFGISIQGIARLDPGDVIKVRFASDNNGTLTINRGNYHVIRN